MANPNYLALTSLTGQILASTRPSATTETTVYTVPAGSTVKITQGVLCNVTAGAVTVSVSVVPSGGTAGAENRILSAHSLAANANLSLADLLGGAMLAEGDFISVLCDAADAVVVTLTGAVSS